MVGAISVFYRDWNLQTLETPRHSFYRRWKFCAATLLAAVSLARAAELTTNELAHLHKALAAMNASVADLGFTKDVGEPRHALQWIRDALGEPLRLNHAGGTLWQAAAADDTARWWSTAAELLEMKPTEPAPEPDSELEMNDVPGALAAGLASFYRSARAAHTLLGSAFRDLDDQARAELAARALAGPFNAEDEERSREALREAGISDDALDAILAEERMLDATPAADAFLRAAQRVDAGAVLAAGRLFHAAVVQLADVAREMDDWPAQTVRIETELGPILVLADGPQRAAEPALLILSRAGDTVYEGGAGSGNGLLHRALAAIIDLAGNDLYRGTGLLAPGVALFGVSVVLDGAGNDASRAAYMGGASACWGAAWFEDCSGDDVYEARALAQGAAIDGVAVLLDRTGNDAYRVGLQGQGFAGWRGFGLLLDRGGHDRYFAGGREPDHERNPDRYMSLAQGFAIGLRPFAGGGVGALLDLDGNDAYDADVYGQGVSYYYSAGFLLDGGGHDVYRVHHYGQGVGIHLSLGLLADFAGDDVYIGGTLAQGAAHDFAVGGLLDRVGNDRYVADRNSQGHGMNNAVGWLLDAAGDDLYTGRDPDKTQGVGNSGGTRESGSIGLLLDLGGADRYSSGGADSCIVPRPWYGVVYDIAAPAVEEARP